MEDGVPDADAATRLIEKIRWFVRDHLDEEERVMFGALVAPGIVAAYREASTEVEGFMVTEWSANIPDSLARALREKGVRVSGIDPSR